MDNYADGQIGNSAADQMIRGGMAGLGGIAAGRPLEPTKLCDLLLETEELLSESNDVVRASADRLFGVTMLNESAKAQTERVDPSISDIVSRILELARRNRTEAMRFNRIG